MTTPVNVEPAANPEVPTNDNFSGLSWALVYARHPESAGLIHKYFGGGRWGGFVVADGVASPITLTASTTNYLVVLRSTGVQSGSTSNTNWNNPTLYARVYQISTSTSGVTTIDDYRAGPGGIFGPVS